MCFIDFGETGLGRLIATRRNGEAGYSTELQRSCYLRVMKWSRCVNFGIVIENGCLVKM